MPLKPSRRYSSCAGLKNAHCGPSVLPRKSSDSAMPCGDSACPAGLRSGWPRSPPVARNQPSAVHSIGSSRAWRPSVQKPFSYPWYIIHQRPSVPSITVAWPRDYQGSAADCVRVIGLLGAFSHGPWIERERAVITMWPVGGPAVPPTAVVM